MSNYLYAFEKFNRAIHTLSTGEDEIRKRLLVVFHGELMMIRPDHLPEECRKDYEWVLTTITKYDEKYKGQKDYFKTKDGRYDNLIPGKVEASLHRIRKNTARQIAEKIYDIWSVLNAKFNE